MIKTTLIVAVAGYVSMAAAQPPDQTPQPRSGAHIFKVYCAKCHATTDASTEGHAQGVPPGLRHILRRITEQQFRKQVMQGKNTMPPFRRKISADELDRLVTYMRTK